MSARNHPAARPKGLGPDDLAQVILDSIDDDEPPTALYTLNIHEARMLANAVQAVANLADRLDDGHLRYLIRNALNGDAA